MFCNRCTNQMYNIDCRCLSWTTKSMQKQHWESLPRLNYFISKHNANIMLHPGGQPATKKHAELLKFKNVPKRHVDSESCALQFPNQPCICKTTTSSILSTALMISGTYSIGVMVAQKWRVSGSCLSAIKLVRYWGSRERCQNAFRALLRYS